MIAKSCGEFNPKSPEPESLPGPSLL